MSELLTDLNGRGVFTITLNRPERSNALSRSLKVSLLESLEYARASTEVAVVVLTGAGDRAFCAGRDLKEFDGEAEDAGPVSHSPMAGVHRNHYEALLELYKPTIAAINGAAVGGGFELALACDLRVAVRGAQVGLPEARRGMGANFGSNVLPRLLPRSIALELLYTGDLVPAESLQEWGLFNRLVDPSDLVEVTSELAESIATNAPLSLRRYKHTATKTWGLPVATALRLEPGPDPYSSDDRVEGVRAFVEKRAPQWGGR